VWVCSRNQSTPRQRPVRDTPYNDEILRHMLVRGHGLLLFNAGRGGIEQDSRTVLEPEADLAVRESVARDPADDVR